MSQSWITLRSRSPDGRSLAEPAWLGVCQPLSRWSWEVGVWGGKVSDGREEAKFVMEKRVAAEERAAKSEGERRRLEGDWVALARESERTGIKGKRLKEKFVV